MIPIVTHGKFRVKRKLDWIRISFILSELGDLDLEVLTYVFNEMFRNTKTNREISGIVVSYKAKGFDFPSKDDPNKKYSYMGNSPMIHYKTKKRWKENIQPLKGLIHTT